MARYVTDLRVRAKQFSLDVYHFARSVSARDALLRRAGEQLFDAATSIGANLAESDGFNTRKELAARYAIALKEAREAFYWLELIAKADPAFEPQAAPLATECKELIAMTAAALRKLRP
jgi:four helix bundle protein